MLEGRDLVGDDELVFCDLGVGCLQEAQAEALRGFHGPELFPIDGGVASFDEVVGIRSLEGLGEGVSEAGSTVDGGGIKGEGYRLGGDKGAGPIVNGDELAVLREGGDAVGDGVLAFLAAIDANDPFVLSSQVEGAKAIGVGDEDDFVDFGTG